MKASRIFRLLLLTGVVCFAAACSDTSDTDADDALEGSDDAVKEAGDAIRESMQ